jgi:ATP/maltotriose-dependent transcriptional regulator MalT
MMMQGKLAEAEAIMNEVLNQPREWGNYGGTGKGRSGSNPYARRGLARALAGDVNGAFDDFKQADEFAKEYTYFHFFKSRDWHHKTLYAACLARLGYLSGAQSKLDRMNIEQIRGYRPLTTAEFDLSSAEIAYARGDYERAKEHADRVLAWGNESGHKHMQARAEIILAKVALRADDFEKADDLLATARTISEESGFALQKVDGLILSGYLRLLSGDMDRAEKAAMDAETISEPLPYRWGVGDAMHLRARCAEARGDAESAREQGARALAVREQIQDPKVSYTRALLERAAPKNDS